MNIIIQEAKREPGQPPSLYVAFTGLPGADDTLRGYGPTPAWALGDLLLSNPDIEKALGAHIVQRAVAGPVSMYQVETAGGLKREKKGGK